MAEASAHKLSFVEEAVRGTTPTNPRFAKLPDTRTTIALQKDTLTSERLTGDRFPAEPRTGASSVGGEIPVDLSFQTYNDFIASALQGEWDAQGTVPPTIASPDAAFTYGTREANEDSCSITYVTNANVAPQTIADINEGSSWTSANGTVTVEEIDTVEQSVVLFFDDSANGGASPAQIELSLTGTATGTIDAEEVTLASVTNAVGSEIVKAGDTRKSFSVLREFSDLGGAEKFLMFDGCEISTMAITASANAIATASFTIFGQGGGDPLTAAPAGTSYKDAIDSQPFDTFSGFLQIDGVATCVVTEFNMNVNNGHAARYGVGCPDSQDPTVTQSVIDGSLTAYFNDMDLYKKFVDESSFSLRLAFADAAGNQLEIFLPKLRVGSGTQPDVTADGPITIPINFTAHKDDTEGTHLVMKSTEFTP